MEIFKDVEGYEGLYQISNMGRVKRLERVIKGKNNYTHTCYEKILNLSRNKYLRVTVSVNWVIKTQSVHRLVAAAFIPNPDKKCCINHKNGIKYDNRVENLEWATYAENMAHAYRTGLKHAKRGEQHYNTKLSENQVREIKKLKGVEYYKDVANRYNINKRTVHHIWNNEYWKHVAV